MKNQQKAFTLVELLTTIAIVSIIATVSVIGYTGFVKDACLSNDMMLSEQLNVFLDAASVEDPDIDKHDILEILEDAGMESIDLQSDKYGYALYYSMLSESFEMLERDKVQNSEYYILIDDEFLSSDDSSEPVLTPDPEPTSKPEPTPDPEPAPDPEPTPEPEPEPNKDPELVLADMDRISGAKKTYLYSENGILNIGISISDDNEIKKYVLECGLLKIIDVNTGDVWSVSAMSLDGESFVQRIEFSECGARTLYLRSSRDGKTLYLEIPVKIWNAYCDDSVLTVCHKERYAVAETMNESGGYDVRLKITGFKSSIEICEYNVHESQYSNRDLLDNAGFIDDMKMTVSFGDEVHEVKIDRDTESLDLVYKNISPTGGELVCVVTFYYQGVNGTWVNTSLTFVNGELVN